MAKHGLSDGEKVEYALTFQLEAHSTPMWIRMGGETVVRSTETASKAMERLGAFVESELDKKITELRG